MYSPTSKGPRMEDISSLNQREFSILVKLARGGRMQDRERATIMGRLKGRALQIAQALAGEKSTPAAQASAEGFVKWTRGATS